MSPESQHASRWVEKWQPEDVLRVLREVIDFAPHVSDHIAQELGMRRRDVEAMTHLLSAPMGPAELSRRLGISVPAATQLVDRLTARGHVRRIAHPQDKRMTVLETTESAKGEVFSRLMPMFLGFNHAAEALAADERAVVVSFLSNCLEVMKRTVAASRPKHNSDST